MSLADLVSAVRSLSPAAPPMTPPVAVGSLRMWLARTPHPPYMLRA